MNLGIDPKVDYAFKKLFASESNKPLLIDFLASLLDPHWLKTPIANLDLLNPFNDKEVPEDKTSVLDVKARDQAGRVYHIEMQMRTVAVYVSRALYYWSRINSQELTANQRYENLPPIASVHVLNQPQFPQVADYHLSFSLRCDQHPHLRFTSNFAIHLIELPKFQLKADQVKTPLERWCHFLRNAAKLDPAALPDSLQGPLFQQAMETLRVMNQTQLERENYETRLKAQLDLNTFQAEAEQRGLKRGLTQGRTQGRKKGLAEGLKKGLVEGERNAIVLALQIKFGQDGLNLADSVLAIKDLPKLQALRQCLLDVSTLDEFRVALAS